MPDRFKNREEAELYVSGRQITCLECGKKFTILARHLMTCHGMSQDEYRKKYNIPASIPLAGVEYREKHREKIKRLQNDGVLDYSHLPKAVEAAKNSGRGDKRDFDRNLQRSLMKSINESGRAYRRTK